MKVYVVVGNDFPDCVFVSEIKAENYCDRRRREVRESKLPRIHWRVYEFELKDAP